jgi:hypothetical protein
MVGMARLAALGASRRQERWIVLDFFSSEAAIGLRRRLTPRTEQASPRRHERGACLHPGAAGDSRRGRQFPEADFAAFEVAANRSGELRWALAEGRERRALKTPLIPSRPARPSVGAVDRQALIRGLEAVQEREHPQGLIRARQARRRVEAVYPPHGVARRRLTSRTGFCYRHRPMVSGGPPRSGPQGRRCKSAATASL